jgi:diguanylate cyclase (GGDEF)-like protein
MACSTNAGRGSQLTEIQQSKATLAVIILALLALVLSAVMPIVAFKQLQATHGQSDESREAIQAVDAILISMIDTETGHRGYVITNNPIFLEPYYKARARLDDQLQQLHKLASTHEAQVRNFQELKRSVESSLERTAESIAVMQEQGFDAALERTKSGEGKARMDRVRAAANKYKAFEINELNALAQKESEIVAFNNYLLVFLTVMGFLLFSFAFFILTKAVSATKRTQEKLNELHQQSLEHTEILSARNKTKNIQARLVDVLHSVIAPDEAYTAIEKYCIQLFPHNSGALYIRSNSKDYFDIKANWSALPLDGFEPNECWAARSNHAYLYDSAKDALPCLHIPGGQMTSLCIPIASTDEMIGTLTLFGAMGADGERLPVLPEVEELATEVVNQIGLALTNLRLKDSLRNSSIIDALTGLYNRRYLDETLPREIARAQRSNQEIGLIMLDVDHFKSFNDNYGHEAGDMVLREIGATIKRVCRISDLACRFGGEELMIMMPQADLKIATERAELICQEIKKITLMYGGQALPTVTISAGLAMFPAHGYLVEDLLKAADVALYRAKGKGRNRLEIASPFNQQDLQALS